MVKRICTQLHRWIGVPVGILFIVALVSGIVVGGADWLRVSDRKGQTYRQTSIAEDARALERMTADLPALFQAVMPTPRTPFYQARVRGGETRTYRIGDLGVVDRDVTPAGGGFYRLALGLHRTFLLGRQGGAFGISGAEYVAWVGLIASALGLVGVWLWWSYRRTFRWIEMVPAKWTRRRMFRSHMTGGLVALVPIVLLCVTGAAITYRGAARAVLGASQTSDVGIRAFPHYVARDWEAWLTTAREAIEGDLAVVSFPRGRGAAGAEGVPGAAEYGVVNPAGAVQFRFVTDSDWLGVAGSRVYVDPRQSALIGAARFGDLPLGQRLYSVIVAAHAGRGTAPGYLAALVIASVLATVMTFAGIVSYAFKHVRVPLGVGAEWRRGLLAGLFGRQSESQAAIVGPGRRKAPAGRSEMRNVVTAVVVSVVLGGYGGYVVGVALTERAATADGGNAVGPSQARRGAGGPGGPGGMNRGGMGGPGGMNRGGRGGGGRGGHSHGGPNAGGGGPNAGRGGLGRGGGPAAFAGRGGPGPRGGRRGGGAPAPVNRFAPADLERSLAHMSVALTLDAAQQQAIREVMQAFGDRQRDRQGRLDALRDTAAGFDFSGGDAAARREELMAGGAAITSESLRDSVQMRESILAVLEPAQIGTLTELEAGESPGGGRPRGRAAVGSGEPARERRGNAGRESAP